MEEVITTTNLSIPYSYDTSISKKELIDIEFARQLLSHTNTSKEDKSKLRCILNNVIKHTSELEVHYKLGTKSKEQQLGRLYANKGLQNLQKEIRAALAQNYYWDIDIVNAQPTILKEYCEQNGLDCTNLKKYIIDREKILKELCDSMNIERSEAKEKINAIMFGGDSIGMPIWFQKDFKDEMRKIQICIWDKHYDELKKIRNENNKFGKGLAYILQTIERKILIEMDNSLIRHGRQMDTLIHDGGLVRKKDNEQIFPESLLNEIEKEIKDKTGYNINLLSKPIITTYTKEVESDTYIPINIIVDDAFAAKKFANLMKDHILLDSGSVWIFDKYTGIWSSDETHIQRVITQCGNKLIFKQNDKTFNYSGVVKNTKNLMIKLPDILPKKDGYMLSKSHSDIGKLLFTNGIYDFYTGKFIEEFDSNIIFRSSMPRQFPIKDQDKVNFIRDISFNDAFEDVGSKDTLLHNLMRASIGDFKRKKMTVGLGFTNSGKGMLTQLVRNSFGNYCSSFNGNSLIGSYDGGESSRKIGWVSDIANSRFAFSSEIQIEERNHISIDGNLLKSIVSGGDELKTRKLYSNDQTIVNKSTLFILANDMPKISPVDDAIRERIQVVNWSYSYTNEPKKSYEKKSNPNLSELYKQDEYGDSFFWLMVEEFEKWKLTNFKEPIVPECVLQGRDDIMPTIDIEEVLLQKYEITKNPEDFIPYTFISEWLKENNVKDSNTKIGRELTALGLFTKNKKVDRKCISIRTGIKERTD